MTDETAPMSAEETAGRAMVARMTYEKEAIWLPLLAVQHWNASEMVIANKTFTDCLIEGPAVMAVLRGTVFENCAMGTTTDVKSLLYRPISDQKMAGVVGMMDCRFVRCRFVQIGFTGADDMLEELATNVRPLSEPSA